MGTDGYTPPELIGKDFHNIEQYIYHDNFRLGVLIYQLLFSYHPFSLGHWQGAGDKPEQNELIKQGIWIESDHNLLIHNQNTIPLNILHPAIQKLFKKCFNEGHSQPHLRPSAEDWFYALSQGVNHLKVCDQIDSHVHSSLENNCYWCDQKSKLGADIFELPTGIKSTSKIRIKNKSNPNQTKKKSNSQQNINKIISLTLLKVFSTLSINERLKQVTKIFTLKFFIFLIFPVVTNLTLFAIIKFGINFLIKLGIDRVMIPSLILVLLLIPVWILVFLSYLHKNLKTFKIIRNWSIFWLSSMTGFSWLGGIVWGILGLIISLILSGIFIFFL